MTTTKTTTPAPTYGELSDDQRGRVRYVYNVRHAGEFVNHGERADEYDALAAEMFGPDAEDDARESAAVTAYWQNIGHELVAAEIETAHAEALTEDRARNADRIARAANAAHAARYGITGDDTDLYDHDAAELDEWDAADDRNED